jgi:hypothetical protein
MKILLCLTVLLLAFDAARAGDSKPTPSPAKVAPVAPVVETKPAVSGTTTMASLRTKSVFSASVNDHNPFWPIGWVKTESLPSDTAAAVIVPHAEDFTVSSILLNEPPMAVINGKEMAEGEIAAVTVNGQPVMVQLIAVQDGRVILRWQNQNLVIPLHRNEALTPVTALR